MKNALSTHTEVCLYVDADWAPGKDIAKFRWAWRVITANGNSVSGVCNGTKTEAKLKAKHTAERMAKLATGDYVGRSLRLPKKG